jgi:hypothetical protein
MDGADHLDRAPAARIMGTMALFDFPNPVNEKAARVVAAGVVVLCAATLLLRSPVLLTLLALGFLARVATGPTLSPLGQLATRVIAPRLGPARPVAGPPKRFAQGIGVLCTGAAVLAYALGMVDVAWALVALVGVFALLEAALAFCLGCRIFAVLQRLGVIPESVCAACADLSLRYAD